MATLSNIGMSGISPYRSNTASNNTSMLPDKNIRILFEGGNYAHLSATGRELCSDIGVNPTDLIPRNLDSFAEKGITTDIQKLRHEHYEQKRQEKLKRLAEALDRKSLSPVRIKKKAESFNGFYITEASFFSPNTTLKDTGDIFEMESRKLERWKKVKENLERMADENEKDYQDRMKKEEQKRKRLQEEQRKMEREKREKLKFLEQKRGEAIGYFRQSTNTINEKGFEELKSHIKEAEAIEAERKERERLESEKALRNFKDQHRQQLKRMEELKKDFQESQKQIEENLKAIENKVGRGTDKKSSLNAERMSNAIRYAEKLSKAKEDYMKKCEENLLHSFEKVVNKANTCDLKTKKKQRTLSNITRKHNTRITNKFDRYKETKSFLDSEKEEYDRKLLEKHDKQDQNVIETKNQIMNEVSKRKEFHSLRKYDQLDNFQRERSNFEKFQQNILAKHQAIEHKKEFIKETRQQIVDMKLRNHNEIQEANRQLTAGPFGYRRTSTSPIKNKEVGLASPLSPEDTSKL